MTYFIFLRDNSHKDAWTITLEQYEEAQAEGNQGFCLACGEQQDGCEPDARGYDCECCGEPQVFGADEMLMMGLVR
jgi:hypothetical protein